MKKTNVVQIVTLAVFGVAIVFATLLFSGKLPFGQGGSDQIKGTLVLWGTFPESVVQPVLDSGLKTYKDLKVTYVRKSEATFDTDLLSALASGKGPDLFFVSHDDLKKRTPQLFAIPFTSFPESLYSSTFIDQADRNLTPDGVVAIPIGVDPMVLYYNKDLLSSGFVVAPPKTWADLIAMTPSLTKKTDAGVISQSAVAMGSYDNIVHAKDIMALLSLQAGNPLVSHDDTRYFGTLTDVDVTRQATFANAMNLYLSFANPTSMQYTWNPSLPNDKALFGAGKLAMYIGYASELQGFRDKNPNLNFDVAFVPQPKNALRTISFGRIYSLGISTLSQKKSLAVTFANWFAGTEGVKEFDGLSGLVPARKDLLSNKPQDDARGTLIYNSAIASRSWYDPEPISTSALFRKLVTQVQGGASSLEQLLPQMNTDLEILLR
jgi:multiple sugar transport system substrate-binding protein